ncbi:glycerophosphodiester phosphodiesterase family protein [Henriciella mobilis]|nr:glycerophosphodiester phosphodiesterase family protein [Henriciella mobilis]
MKHAKTLAISIAMGSLTLSGCQQVTGSQAVGADMAAAQGPADVTPLAGLFDCVREEGGILLAAHRGGPAPGYPENAIETLDHVLSNAAFITEVDVAETSDGVLFLMHDDTLDRTTSGSGAVADTDWADISTLDLVDNEGTVTNFHPPRLTAALDWAVRNGAILELDRKDTTSFAGIIAAVREAGAEANAVLITYDDAEAREVARLAPDLMMTADPGDAAQDSGLLEGTLNPQTLIAWTGTSSPDPAVWAALAEADIESAFGTLGAEGERLDDQYWADGDPSEYSQLARDGLTLLATDVPYRLARADGWIGTAQDISRKECMYGFRD